MKAGLFLLSLCLMFTPCVGRADALDELDGAIQNAIDQCSEVTKVLNRLKNNATLSAILSGASTVGMGATIGSGIALSKTDDPDATDIVIKGDPTEFPVIVDCDDTLLTRNGERWEFEYINDENGKQKCQINNKSARYSKVARELQDKKENALDSVATVGFLTSLFGNAGSLATAMMGEKATTGQNAVQNCASAVQKLSNARLKVRVEYANTANKNPSMERAKKIISGCRDYELLDWSKINNTKKLATVSTGVGLGTEVAALMVNKGQVGLLGTSTAASATATVLNAVQISEIKKAIKVAEECKSALGE